MQDLIAKAATLLEALPYIQKFSGATFVIKYGGSFMDSPDPNIRNGVARDIVFLEAVEINPVIVHGGGKAITRAMDKAGLKASFIQGQRVSDEATVRIADEVLSREINPEIVAAIKSFGGAARGFAGPDIFKCHKIQMKEPMARRWILATWAKLPRLTPAHCGNASSRASHRSSVRRPEAETARFITATLMLPRLTSLLRSKPNGWSS